ncbi:ACP S-malonyltransferase [Parafrankia elaeagni]|uniref:ACP S-malonyltransferase n=1 Tax=Parafrankia elaeagni TaxID=222534 RepID=UPI000370849B|nr:ACP S-malonyltransferase [Parafrankia elaeagni]
MSTAILFPALGPVRRNELGKFLMIDPAGRQLVAEASDALGYHLADALAEAGDDDYAEAVQVSFAVGSLALAAWAERELGAEPACCVGPSFGERPALAYTGALPVADTVRLVAEIARAEREYFGAEHGDVVTQSFTRVPEERLRPLLDGLSDWYEISGYLDADFHMVSLREHELDRFKAGVSEAGGYCLYTMRPPAHAGIFTGLRDRIAAHVSARYELAAPRVPVVSYQDGTVLNDPDALREALADGFVRAIRWPDTVRSLRAQGVRTLYITGPDNMFHRVRPTLDNFEIELVDLRRVLRRPRSR